MQNHENTLSGTDNKRLDSVKPTNNEGTAAWTNDDKQTHNAKVNIPSAYNVEKAKNWVDNGSKL